MFSLFLYQNATAAKISAKNSTQKETWATANVFVNIQTLLLRFTKAPGLALEAKELLKVSCAFPRNAPTLKVIATK